MIKLPTFLAAAALALVASQALAESCSPKSNAARILRSANPNDIHPDWRGDSSIGTSWTLEVTRHVQTQTGRYLEGDLVSPRGGTVNRDVFALAIEWDCQP